MKQVQAILTVVVAVSIATAAPVDLTIGARGLGLGGAYCAVVNDASAAYWNPAALSRLGGMSLMESNWIFQNLEDVNINYLTFAVPLSKVGTISASWLLQYATLESGPDAEQQKAGENLISLSFGRALWNKALFLERTSLGFSINRYAFNTEEVDATGLGFDLAFWTGLPAGFSLGVVGRNILAEMDGEFVNPELRFGVGFSRVFKDMHRVTVAVDGSYKRDRDYVSSTTLSPADNNMRAYGGLEYGIRLADWEIAVRGGLSAPLYSTLETYTYTAGLGVSFMGYSVQYAFRGETDADVSLGYSHRIDLLLKLNRLYRKAADTPQEPAPATE